MFIKLILKHLGTKYQKKFQNIILYGDENNSESFICDFEGIINFIDRKYSETERWWVQYELEKYLSERDCEVCNGFRLNKKALAIKIAGNHIGRNNKNLLMIAMIGSINYPKSYLQMKIKLQKV